MQHWHSARSLICSSQEPHFNVTTFNTWKYFMSATNSSSTPWISRFGNASKKERTIFQIVKTRLWNTRTLKTPISTQLIAKARSSTCLMSWSIPTSTRTMMSRIWCNVSSQLTSWRLVNSLGELSCVIKPVWCRTILKKDCLGIFVCFMTKLQVLSLHNSRITSLFNGIENRWQWCCKVKSKYMKN